MSDLTTRLSFALRSGTSNRIPVRRRTSFSAQEEVVLYGGDFLFWIPESAIMSSEKGLTVLFDPDMLKKRRDFPTSDQLIMVMRRNEMVSMTMTESTHHRVVKSNKMGIATFVNWLSNNPYREKGMLDVDNVHLYPDYSYVFERYGHCVDGFARNVDEISRTRITNARFPLVWVAPQDIITGIPGEQEGYGVHAECLYSLYETDRFTVGLRRDDYLHRNKRVIEIHHAGVRKDLHKFTTKFTEGMPVITVVLLRFPRSGVSRA